MGVGYKYPTGGRVRLKLALAATSSSTVQQPACMGQAFF